MTKKHLYSKTDTLMINTKLKGIVLSPLGRHKFNYCYLVATKETNK